MLSPGEELEIVKNVKRTKHHETRLRKGRQSTRSLNRLEFKSNKLPEKFWGYRSSKVKISGDAIKRKQGGLYLTEPAQTKGEITQNTQNSVKTEDEKGRGGRVKRPSWKKKTES